MQTLLPFPLHLDLKKKKKSPDYSTQISRLMKFKFNSQLIILILNIGGEKKTFKEKS